MTKAATFATIYLYFWLFSGLSELLCSGEPLSSNFGIKNHTIKAEKRTLTSGTDRISQTERNRRLIPYATYYIAGSSASAAGGLDQENSLVSTVSPTQATDDQDQDDIGQPKGPVKIPYKGGENNNEYYDYNDNNEYSYIPVAYIPGAAPSRAPINYNPETHYYPNSYYQSPISTEHSKYYTTAKPPKATPTVSTTTDRKFPFSYLTKYVAQHQAQNDDYYKYLVTPATLKHQINYEIKKPTGVAPAAAAAAAYYSGDASQVIVSTPAPQSEYLNFRYNLYKTQAPKYDVTTTPSTVEITSPKHYLVNKVVSSTYPSQSLQVSHVTTPYAVTYDYPEEQYAAHTQTVRPVTKIPEQVTQSTKTLMTIMKSQELPYQLQQQQQHQQQHQLHHHHHIPTRIQFVPKPYLVPSLNTPAAAAAIDYTVEDILAGYNINKQLPEKITADNIKQSIKTLSYILQVLQKADSITHYNNKPLTALSSHFNSKDIYESLKESPHSAITPIEHNSVSPLPHHVHSYDPYDDVPPKEPVPTTQFINKPPIKDDQSTSGRAGIDYPVLSVIPETAFDCKTQRYKGFFADPETKCQVWHYCDLNGGQASFLCPNGTIFNQAALTCDWWFNVKCAATPQLYVLNERLYKYIIPQRPSFPEDYSGPLVDQYLTEKFREIESQKKHKYPTNSTTSKLEAAANLTALSEYDIPSHLLEENL